MSKKDYQAIAAALYRAREKERVSIAFVLDELIPVLCASNPRFNAGLFREACETGKCKGMRKVGS